MTKQKQERIAKDLLGSFIDVWCSVDERGENSTSNNCYHCEFSTENGICLAKRFVHNQKYSDESITGFVCEKEVE